MRTRLPDARWIFVPAFLAAALCCPSASSMGGHFDADDAVVLAPGRCQVELWAIAARTGGSDTEHVGTACRTGPVELGLNLDRAADAGVLARVAGVQLKWVVDPLLPGVSAGLVAGVGRDVRHGGAVSGSLFVPVTWFATEQLQFHVNLGWDRDSSGAGFRRKCLAAEWAATDRFALIGEVLRIGGQRSTRAGMRFGLDDFTSLDFSALRSATNGAHRFAIGLNHEFDR